MPQFLILPIHSNADVITNSSSELFICNTEKTRLEIIDMLNTLATITGHHGVGDIKVFYGVEGLKLILADLGSYYYDNLYLIIGRFIPYGDTKEESDRRSVLFKTIPRYNRYNIDYRISDWKSEIDKDEQNRADFELSVNSWLDENSEYLSNFIHNITTIRSKEDNSMPYDIFDILETRLNAERFHIG